MIFKDGKYTNYRFVSASTYIFEVEEMFREQGTLEAILITKDGNPNGNLLGNHQTKRYLSSSRKGLIFVSYLFYYQWLVDRT